ncbi:uncharacterized protein LOC126741512 [Anthonomus grandis grandis]|uniref:uncharacterized protein LOC126741512 n=1 Tax=Anthonomus grandis grandis TaxID=2921223 RepID=UPI002165898F|nr:uncharacterized protein LOC126741512 [Anthonomus grandis grandis]
MRLPREILEKIFLYCDGITLLYARISCEELRDIVDYLSQKTRIWEWCCNEEIPSEELVDYFPTYHKLGTEKWMKMYIHWYSWHSNSNCFLDPVPCPNEFQLKRISCIAVSSHHIAIGSEDGRVKLFTRNWNPVFEHRVVAVKLTKISFIGYNDYNDVNFLDIGLLVAFPKGLSILSFNGVRKYQYDILDIISHSVFGNHICIEKIGGRMSIVKITKQYDFKEIWFTRVYSPHCITAYQMWNGKCTFLINDSVMSLNYSKPTLTPMEQMEKLMEVKFVSTLMLDSRTTQIFRDDVIINIYKNADKSKRLLDIEDYVEIIILGKDNQYSKKIYNMWDIFRCRITCIYLYGNSLLIGTDIGVVYFYSLSKWKNFDMKNYTEKQIIGKHPIICITAIVTGNDRDFYICSRFAIHKVVGWTPCSSKPNIFAVPFK